MTFQPAPRKSPSSSWMIFPLPRTGPSSRCKLQLMTQIRLSRFSRAPSVIAPSVSGFVAFAVAEKRPDFRLVLPIRQTARLQIAVKARLIQRHDRAEAHRDRRELPEIRHQIRMRIRRQPAAFGQFLPEILQMPFVQPAFEKRARIHSRRGVALKINDVAGEIFRRAAEKMIERHFVKRRRRSVSRDVAADVRGRIGLDHHRHRVPAHEAFDAALDVASRPDTAAVAPTGIVLT